MGPVIFDKTENKLIEFGDSTEFVIGRSIDHHLCIPDSTISRKQCIIKKVPEGEWLVKDMSSFKTTLVNGSSVTPSGVYLKSGDIISFGTLRSWHLEFYHSTEDMPPTTKRRRVVDNAVEPSSQELLTSRPTDLGESTQAKKPRKNLTIDFEEKYKAAELKNANLTELVGQLNERINELADAKETADDILVSSHLDRKQLQTDFEDSCLEIDHLVKERHALLEELQDNIKKREASEALANAGGSSSPTSSSEIESSLILKTIEVEELKDELAEAKVSLAKAEEVASNMTMKNEKIYNDAVAIIEQEFLCCVCSDLLYEPVTLNCRHTMCGDCLKEWKKKKKECPSCRTKIKTEVRPLMIDSFIDRIAPLLGDEFVKKRQEAKNDRAAPKTPPPSMYAPPPPGPSYSGGRGRRASRRGGRGGYQNRLQPVSSNMNGAVIDLTNQANVSPVHNRRRSDSDQTDEDEDSNFDSLQDVVDLVETLDYLDGSGDEYPFIDSDVDLDEFDDEDEYDEEDEFDEDDDDEDDTEDYEL